MNKILPLLLTFVSYAFAADIEVYTQTTAPWNMFLFEKAENLMKTLGKDYQLRTFSYEEEEIRYDNSTIEEFLTPSSGAFLTRIEDVSGLKILGIKPELSLDKIGYQLYNIAPDIKVSEISDGLQLDFEVTINGLDVYADSVNLDFVLSQLVSDQKVTALKVKMLKPEVVFDHSLSMSVDVSVELIKRNGIFEMKVLKVDSSRLVNQLRESSHLFDIGFQDFTISDVSLDIFGRTITVDAEKIKNTIRENKDDLKTIIIDQMAKLIEKDGLKAIVNRIESFPLPEEQWFNFEEEDDELPLRVGMQEVRKIDEQILKVDLYSDFCTGKGFRSYVFDCVTEDPTIIRSYPRSKEEIRQTDEIAKDLIKSRAQLVVSVDEDYMTRLVNTIHRAGLLDEIVEELDIEIGSQKALLRFDTAGNRADLIVDVKHRLGGLTGFVLTKRTLRFPLHLHMDVSVRDIVTDFEDEQGVKHNQVSMPHIIFTIRDVDLDHGKIRYGISEYEFLSNVDETLFGTRGLVVRKIQKELLEYDEETQTLGFNNKAWDGVELPPLIFPLIKNLDIDKVRFESTGMGRGLFILSNDQFESLNTTEL